MKNTKQENPVRVLKRSKYIDADYKEELKAVEYWLDRHKFYGIGEIGIDLHWDKTYKNEYSFLNANLYYQQKDSKWEFKFTANNITNNTSINTDSYNEITDSNSATLYYIQPRLWLFSVKYNI